MENMFTLLTAFAACSLHNRLQPLMKKLRHNNQSPFLAIKFNRNSYCAAAYTQVHQ